VPHGVEHGTGARWHDVNTEETSMAKAPDPQSESVFWSRLQSLLPVLNPLLVLVVGFVLNNEIITTKQKIDQNLIEIQALKTEAETSGIKSRIQVDKVKVVQDFLEALSGENETKRRVAIEAIFIVLPDEAPRLVRAIEQKSAGQGTADAAAASTALDNSRSRLVADMFAADRPTRVAALHALQQAWANDGVAIGQLIDRATQDIQARAAAGWGPPATDSARQQLSSLSNTAEFLTSASITDPGLRAKAVAFAAAATPNSSDTARFAGLIKERFR
jgi:hypothetical protein